MSSLPSITWLETVKSYLDKRLLWVFMLGCSSGFPWVLIGSNMSGWLKDAGLTLSAIGFFGSVFAVYAINFLWAPLVDRVKLPILHARLGQRRSWILLTQSIMLILTLAMAWYGPNVSFQKFEDNDHSVLSINSRDSWREETASVYWTPKEGSWSTSLYSTLTLSYQTSDFDNLTITILETGGNTHTLQQTLHATQGARWHTLEVSLPNIETMKELKFSFEGVGQVSIANVGLTEPTTHSTKYFPIRDDYAKVDTNLNYWNVKAPSQAWVNYSTILVLSLIALGIATASATQDIAIDAFRIDTFPKSESSKLPQASAMSVIGWWTGYSLPGYLAFINADTIGWNGVYWGMAFVVVILIIFTLLVGEPKTLREQLQSEAEQRHKEVVGSRLVAWFTVTVIEPFLDFFNRNGVRVAISLLLFVFLFKIGEAFLGRMSIAFYKDIGFSNEQIGHYSKLIGWGATIFFTFVGSMFNVKFGIVRGLMIGGIAMSASNLMFAWIASVGPNEHLYLATIIVDNFTTAFSTVAFVSFLTILTGQAFSATQYALLASLGNFGRTTLASFSGQLVDYLNDWSAFFILTALMVIPSLIMLYSLRHYFDELLEKARNHKD